MLTTLFNPTLTFKNAEYDPGEIGFAQEPNGTGEAGFMFCRAGAALTSQQFIVIQNSGIAMPITKALWDERHWLGGVARNAVPDDEYCWIQVFGYCLINVAASVTSGADLYTSATAGALDDDMTSQTRVYGVSGGGGANRIFGFVNWPHK